MYEVGGDKEGGLMGINGNVCQLTIYDLNVLNYGL